MKSCQVLIETGDYPTLYEKYNGSVAVGTYMYQEVQPQRKRPGVAVAFFGDGAPRPLWVSVSDTKYWDQGNMYHDAGMSPTLAKYVQGMGGRMQMELAPEAVKLVAKVVPTYGQWHSPFYLGVTVPMYPKLYPLAGFEVPPDTPELLKHPGLKKKNR